MSTPTLLHISVAADVLGLSIRKVRSLCDAGKLPRETRDRLTYIPAKSIGDYVRSIIEDTDDAGAVLAFGSAEPIACNT